MSGIPQIGPQEAPLGGQVDPQSQYLAQALKSMAARPQGNVTGLSGNLLATAIMKYMNGQGANPSAGPIQLQGPPTLVPTSNALPDVSYG